MKTYEEIRALTDDQLSHELTETRITLESIYPYKCKDVSIYRSRLLQVHRERFPVRTPACSANVPCGGDTPVIPGTRYAADFPG